MRRFLWLLALAAPLAAAPKEIVLDRDDIEVTEDVVVKPGAYVVIDADGDGVLHVNADGVTVDFQGAALLGSTDDVPQDACDGIGIRVDGRSKVTVRNAVLSGFKAAIVASSCKELTIEGCSFRRNYAMRLKSTPEAEDAGDWLWPHENDKLEWRKAYGGAISLEGCEDCVVRQNTARAQQNGVLLTRCSRIQAYDNDMSYLSGWGLAMYRTCDSVVSHNSFDWCVRGYSHGVYARGQDSAGILVFEQCSRNVFAHNSATHGGDGFFLYAGHETTQRTGKGGCNGNLVYQNDFSHAVANGIEATFSDGNQFVANILRECDYGIWGGYSYNTYIAGNVISESLTAGIAIEHGHDNVIEGNAFTSNALGIWLWWDEDMDLVQGVYGKNQDTKSRGYRIKWNCFMANTDQWRLADTSDIDAEENGGESVDTSRRSRTIEPPTVPGKREAFLPAGHRRGREYMIVDEWGPYDFVAPRVVPRTATSWGDATFRVLGPEVGFAIEEATGDVEIDPPLGKLPATIQVRRGEAADSSYVPFSFDVRLEGSKQPLGVKGVLLQATWEVSFFSWTRSPIDEPEAWKTLTGSKPVATETLDRLAYAWGGGGPEGVVPDRFGTVATTELTLPAGRYVVRTTSDDGVRVWMDGELAIDNWTLHGPTEDRATIELSEGKHAVRIEHFEQDGYAVLSFTIEQAR